MPDPNMTPARAYDQARKEFYERRLHQDVERRIAKEEAMATGAYFGKTVLQIGTELEDKAFEEWKVWASKETVKMEQKMAAMYTGVVTQSPATEEKDPEAEAENAVREGSIAMQQEEVSEGAVVGS